MTDQEASDLATFAAQAMPKSKEGQKIVLREAIKRYPIEIATEAIVEHGTESEFISPPEIVRRIREKLGPNMAAQLDREMLKQAEHAAKCRMAIEIRDAKRRAGEIDTYGEEANRIASRISAMPPDELDLRLKQGLATLKPDSAAFFARHNVKKSPFLQALIVKTDDMAKAFD